MQVLQAWLIYKRTVQEMNTASIDKSKDYIKTR